MLSADTFFLENLKSSIFFKFLKYYDCATMEEYEPTFLVGHRG